MLFTAKKIMYHPHSAFHLFDLPTVSSTSDIVKSKQKAITASKIRSLRLKSTEKARMTNKCRISVES